MSFVHPAWLLAGLLACVALIAVWRRYDARQRDALELLLAPQLRTQLTGSISHVRRTGKRVLFAAAIALLCVALAAPQAGFRWEQVQRRGNDIVFAIDTSRSMDTPDVKPTRLARAKLAVGDFVDHLNGDAVGLIAFAGSAFLQTPITLDYEAFHDSLNALDTHIIPRGGTDIASAIRETQAALHNRPGSDKILILVTDGEDLEGDALAAAKTAAQQDGLKIFTVGVGTTNGDLIPLPADQGGGFLKDADGHLVKSRLDEAALKALAAATGGSYVPLGAANEGLDAIYQQALAPLAKHELDARQHKVYTQRYQWPLGAALALLLASLMIGTRRRSPAALQARPAEARPAQARPAAQPSGRAAVTTAALLIAAGLVSIPSAHASPADAVKAYQEGRFTDAAQGFSQAAQKNPQQPALQFDAGAAAYKAGAYPQAAQAFESSVNAAKSGNQKRLAEQEDAYYNLGNTQYREGQKTQQTDREGTIATWTQAVKSYTAALQLRPDDSDSQFNRDLVQRKLDELKKQPPPQNQSKQDQPKQDQSKQDQSKQGQSQQNQPQQSKSGQGQPKPDSGKPDKPGAPQPGAPQPAAAQQPGGSQPSDTKAQQSPGQQAPAPDASAPRDGNAQQLAQSGDDQRQPGEMSRAEARELLDSVKKDQARLPATPLARNGTDERTSNEPAKDW